MRHLISVILLGLAIVPLSQPVQAGEVGHVAGEIAGAVFTETEKRIIRDYYHRRHGDYRDHDHADRDYRKGKKGKKGKDGLPPGLAKKDSLPPGLQKQVERYGRLPPGLEKRALPSDLRHRLPRRSYEYERVIADGKVLLIDRASGIIADIISDLVLDD